jgi:hypothetical protein
LQALGMQAADLVAETNDYENAAKDAGWVQDDDVGIIFVQTNTGTRTAVHGGWKGVCEKDDIAPYHRVPMEWWAVSPWLGEQLADRGQRVDKEFGGLCVWARCTSGQSISDDSVIVAIAEERGPR